jgi:hypothetical protein
MMGVCLKYHGHENNQVYKISWIKTRTKVIPNPNMKQENDKCKTRIQHDFIARTKQKQNKAMTRKCTQN